MNSKILATIAVIVIAIIIAFFALNEKEHIDGNIMNLTYLHYDTPREGSVAPAWINNTIIYPALFRPLVLANHDLTEFKPALATSYSISDDGLEYRFVKRDNLKWSDGVEFTIHDIQASFKAAMELAKNDPTLGEALSAIKEVSSKDGVVTISLKEEYPAFLEAISQFIILPSHILSKPDFNMQDFWRFPVGTGMYTVTENNKDHVKMERNPYYIGTPAKIETIMIYKDKAKQVDMYIATDVADMVNMRAMRGYTEYELPVIYYKYLVFNVEGADGFVNEAMQDLRVRSAIAIALDNQSIVDSIYLNNASGFTIDGAQAYNPVLSMTLLAEAGYDFKRPLRIAYYNQGTTFSYFLNAVVKNLEEVGFKIQLVKANSASELLEKRNFDIMLKDMLVLQEKDFYIELTSTSPYTAIFGTNGEMNKRVFDFRTAKTAEQKASTKAALTQLAGETLLRYPIANLKHTRYIGPRIQLPKGLEFANPWYFTDQRLEEWEIKRK